ncbi:hypothetical protein P8625_03600 [Tenacibaculum tangerinum]|uniref:Suppressor of fused-like domain-containing protein n=1 Tax=Tenacibaculum tangerinum TaxID=3038772 RepID=A0ABY8L6J2_9FLAO|nr:hypothetical protein [Tenacibaculum tangerinum]WGH76262.1 hypothetical protein P8625_03600 [Tenacibaculum tangerinum]
MKYIIIGVITIILVLFNQFRGKKKNNLILLSGNSFETKGNTSEKDKSTLSNLKKINSEDYSRYILTKSTTKSYILKGIKEYGELSGNEEFKIYTFGIAEYGDWKIIKIDPSISFYVYHNLVCWLSGYEEDTAIPKLSIGFSKNKADSQEDYLCFLDPENEYGDTLIGTFRSGESFSIYLPEAYEEYGNLTIKKEIQVSMKENVDYISEQGFNILDIESLKYSEHKIKMNE